MGFMDKVKATVKNADSKAGEMIDESKLKSEIAKEKNNIDKKYSEIGKLYYERYSAGAENFTKELNELCKLIDDSKANITKLEKDIEDLKEAGKKEREENRAAAAAASEEKKEEKNE